jgi:putative membrane protein
MTTPAPPPSQTTAGPASAPVLKATRTSGLWVAVTGFVLLLLLLGIFLLQNSQRVDISYFGVDGHLPLAVAMLLSAVAGALLVAIAGMARVLQLRHTARRERRAQTSA